MATFTADDKVKQEPHQIVICRYVKDSEGYVVQRVTHVHENDSAEEFKPSKFCQLARERRVESLFQVVSGTRDRFVSRPLAT